MDCDSIRPLLADFLEHNVGEEEAEAVRRHVRSCAECGRELDALGRVDEVLQEWRAPELPESVWLNLQPLLPPARREPAAAPLRLSVAFAASCLALLVAWAVWVQPEMSRTFKGTPAPEPTGLRAFEGTPPVFVSPDSRVAPMMEQENQTDTEAVEERSPGPEGEAVLDHTIEPKRLDEKRPDAKAGTPPHHEVTGTASDTP